MLALNDVVPLVDQLSMQDKVRLIEHIAAEIQTELAPQAKQPRQSLYGLWAGHNISAEEIDQARQEMWGNFPREDI